jgi:hypothetical protein
VGWHIIVKQEKNLESRTQLDEPFECSSGGDPLLLYTILHLLFFPPVRILSALRLESRKKNYEHGLDAGPLEFQFLRPRGCLTNPFRTPSPCSGVIGKTLGLISRNNFVKIFLSASVIALMFWRDVTRSSLCSGDKECGTKRAHNFLFPKSSFRIRRTTVLGMFKDSAIILNAIRRSFFTKSTTAAMFTSVRVDFGRPPLSSFSTSSLPSRNREYNLKTFDRFTVLFP